MFFFYGVRLGLVGFSNLLFMYIEYIFYFIIVINLMDNFVVGWIGFVLIVVCVFLLLYMGSIFG